MEKNKKELLKNVAEILFDCEHLKAYGQFSMEKIEEGNVEMAVSWMKDMKVVVDSIMDGMERVKEWMYEWEAKQKKVNLKKGTD